MRRLTIILLVIFMAAVTGIPAWGKPAKSLILEIEPDPAFHAIALKTIAQIEQQTRRRLQRIQATPDENAIKRHVRKQYVDRLTLEEYVNALTPTSRKWFGSFFDNIRRSGEDNFATFFAKHRARTIGDLRTLVRTRATPIVRSRIAQATPHLLAQCAPTGTPNLAGIVSSNGSPASMLIRKDSYACQNRYLIATPDQSLFLRGRNDQASSPYYPDYPNTFCDKCCGPAAGQSILEWFNVTVKNASGNVVTSTHDVQKRLANLMETTDGADYTHPDDLAQTLIRDEFLGSKGYCYTDGDGSLADVDYMLSVGTPVILLIAEEGWAHWITLYGYDRVAGTYSVANDENYTRDRLSSLWAFDNTSWYADAAYGVTGVSSNSLFSYSPHGCNRDWAYRIEHTGVPLTAIGDWDNMYYDMFMDEFVRGRNEHNMNLNFYGLYNFSWFPFTPLTLVSNGDQLVHLSSVHQHVISSATPSEGHAPNQSVGAPMNIEVRVDRQFLDRYAEIHAGFVVTDPAGVAVITRYGPYRNQINVNASTADSNNYVFTLTNAYAANYQTVEFLVHGGFRRAAWVLDGCWNDTDGDKVCDEHDPDIDNDGIPNATDNCPIDYNPGQESTIVPGIGDACWRSRFEVLPDWAAGRLPDVRIFQAIEEIMRHTPRSSPDPCQCKGLCFSCPPQFAEVGNLLKSYARSFAAGRVPAKTFASRVDTFLNGFQYKANRIDVLDSQLALAQGTNSIRMRLIAPTAGLITVRVPDVILDNKTAFFRRDVDMSVSIDGVSVKGREQRAGGIRTIALKIPKGARLLELSGNRSGFE